MDVEFINIHNPLEVSQNLFNIPIGVIGTIEHTYFATSSVQKILKIADYAEIGSTSYMCELATYRYIGDSGAPSALEVLRHIIGALNGQRLRVLNALEQSIIVVSGPLHNHLRSKIKLAEITLARFENKINNTDFERMIKLLENVSI